MKIVADTDSLYCIINNEDHAVVIRWSNQTVAWQAKISSVQVKNIVVDLLHAYIVGTGITGNFFISKLSINTGTPIWFRDIDIDRSNKIQVWQPQASVDISGSVLAITFFTETSTDVRRTLVVTIQYPVDGNLLGKHNGMNIEDSADRVSVGNWSKMVPASTTYNIFNLTLGQARFLAEPYKQNSKNTNYRFSLPNNQWYNFIPGCKLDPPYNITCSGRTFYSNDGSIYVLGSLVDKPGGTNTNENIFVKYSADGKLLWSKDWTDAIGDSCGSFNSNSRVDNDLIYWISHAPDTNVSYIGTSDLLGNIPAVPSAIDSCRLVDLAVSNQHTVYVISNNILAHIDVFTRTVLWAKRSDHTDAFKSIAYNTNGVAVLGYINNNIALTIFDHAGNSYQSFQIDAYTF